jgi:hypothetical protein
MMAQSCLGDDGDHQCYNKHQLQRTHRSLWLHLATSFRSKAKCTSANHETCSLLRSAFGIASIVDVIVFVHCCA